MKPTNFALRRAIVLVLIASAIIVGVVAALFAHEGHGQSTIERINQACVEHGGVQQDIYGVDGVICKDGKAYSY